MLEYKRKLYAVSRTPARDPTWHFLSRNFSLYYFMPTNGQHAITRASQRFVLLVCVYFIFYFSSFITYTFMDCIWWTKSIHLGLKHCDATLLLFLLQLVRNRNGYKPHIDLFSLGTDMMWEEHHLMLQFCCYGFSFVGRLVVQFFAISLLLEGEREVLFPFTIQSQILFSYSLRRWDCA